MKRMNGRQAHIYLHITYENDEDTSVMWINKQEASWIGSRDKED